MLKVENIKKRYNDDVPYVLNNISFNIQQGEIVGLIGKNGEGKSTLLKLLCKFLNPDEGKIYIKDKDIFENYSLLRNVGIHLEPVFFPYLTAYENMVFYLKVNNNENYISQIDEVLELVELKKHKYEKPSSFSFGMKQRLSLAIAMLGEPEILILDEPFVGLDPNGIQRFMNNLKYRVKEKRISAIISSHQLYELSSIADRILVLNKSKIVYDGTPNYNRQINITLDRNYVGNINGDIRIEGNKVITDYQGDRLNDLITALTSDYKIIEIETSKSNLEKFFWGD